MADVVATHRHFPTLVLHSAEELIPERVHSVHCAGRQHVPVVRAAEERDFCGGEQAGEDRTRVLLPGGARGVPRAAGPVNDYRRDVLNEDPEMLGDLCFSDTWLEKVSFARTLQYIGDWAFTSEHTASRNLRTLWRKRRSSSRTRRGTLYCHNFSAF